MAKKNERFVIACKQSGITTEAKIPADREGGPVAAAVRDMED